MQQGTLLPGISVICNYFALQFEILQLDQKQLEQLGVPLEVRAISKGQTGQNGSGRMDSSALVRTWFAHTLRGSLMDGENNMQTNHSARWFLSWAS